MGIVLVSKDFLERAPQSLLIYWRENCTHSRTPKLLVKILILNNKDVMAQSLFALVTTDPGFGRRLLGVKLGNTRSEQMFSALPSKADSTRTSRYVSNVPRRDIVAAPLLFVSARRKLAHVIMPFLLPRIVAV